MLKITDKTNKELNKVIKNFNQKVARLEKLNRENIPSKINKNELTELDSKQALRRKINELKRFSQRGAEDIVTTSAGVNLTKWERKNLGINLRIAKSKITRELKALESTKITVGGKKQDSTFAQAGNSEYITLKAKKNALNNKDINTMTQKELKSLKESTDKIINKTQHKNFDLSYKKMLEDLFHYSDYDKTKAKVIMKTIQSLNNKQILNLFNNDRLMQSVLFYYKSLADNYDFSSQIRDDLDNIYDNLSSIIGDL